MYSSESRHPLGGGGRHTVGMSRPERYKPADAGMAGFGWEEERSAGCEALRMGGGQRLAVVTRQEVHQTPHSPLSFL